MHRIIPSKVVPSLIWFTALAGGPTFSARAAAANVATDSCAALPVSDAATRAGKAVAYRSSEYGFQFSLPQSWKGFRVLACRWDGRRADSDEGDSGPLIVIRHPLYTAESPREDIPIMVFTRAQWRAVSASDPALIVSAAPFPPTEMGRNRRYVFALPPRFSFDELDGVEEVLKITSGHPLKALPIKRAQKTTDGSPR
jgi:hypothetical protein